MAELNTQIVRGNLYRMLERCFAPDEDGRPLQLEGPDAVCPRQRVSTHRPGDGTGQGVVGAFGLLLQTPFQLAARIADRVWNKRLALEQRSTDEVLRTRLRGLKHLHGDFLRECRALRLNAAQYPFIAKQLGIRSL